MLLYRLTRNSAGLFQMSSDYPYKTIVKIMFCCFLSLPGFCNYT